MIALFLEISLVELCRIIWQRMCNQIVELNLFQTQASRADPYEMRTTKMATRIYLVTTCLSVLVLAVYTSIEIRAQTTTILNPSEEVFANLYTRYSSTLGCPCTRLTIAYDDFVALSPQYHPVCSSLFVSSRWIDSISSLNWADEFIDPRDFRVNGAIFFNTLKTLCSSTNLTLSNAWFSFKQSSLISEQLMSEEQLLIRTRATLSQFKSNTIAEFKRTLAVLQFQTTTLLSMGSQNYYIESHEVNNFTEPIGFHTKPQNWSDCSCATNDKCRYSIGFYNISGSEAWDLVSSTWDIPQFFAGCFIIQSVLQSSLECFFNQTCLNKIQSGTVSNNAVHTTILQANTTRFSPETLVVEMIDALLVEQWGEYIHYSQYYEQCASKQCSYRLLSRNSFAYVFVVLLGLCGGIVTALKILIPGVVRLLRNFCRQNPQTDAAIGKSRYRATRKV